jgi:hypothetical protein
MDAKSQRVSFEGKRKVALRQPAYINAWNAKHRPEALTVVERAIDSLLQILRDQPGLKAPVVHGASALADRRHMPPLRSFCKTCPVCGRKT